MWQHNLLSLFFSLQKVVPPCQNLSCYMHSVKFHLQDSEPFYIEWFDSRRSSSQSTFQPAWKVVQ